MSNMTSSTCRHCGEPIRFNSEVGVWIHVTYRALCLRAEPTEMPDAGTASSQTECCARRLFPGETCDACGRINTATIPTDERDARIRALIVVAEGEVAK